MVKGPSMDAQTLALCYGNDLGTESGPEEALTYPKSKQRPNCGSSNKNILRMTKPWYAEMKNHQIHMGKKMEQWKLGQINFPSENDIKAYGKVEHEQG